MVIEILYPEVCSLFGDVQNPVYLQACLPDARFVFTELNDVPYFVENDPDLIYIGAMTEAIQKMVVKRLMTYRERIADLVIKGTPILATGNACEVFANSIEYVHENSTLQALGIVDLNVKTDLMHRFNNKCWGSTKEGITVLGFHSQFSFLYGNNQDNYFLTCHRGEGINPESKLEGYRVNNLIGTQLLGPILPNNPAFCKYLLELIGSERSPAYLKAAEVAFEQRLKEFQSPNTTFEPSWWHAS